MAIEWVLGEGGRNDKGWSVNRTTEAFAEEVLRWGEGCVRSVAFGERGGTGREVWLEGEGVGEGKERTLVGRSVEIDDKFWKRD